MVSLKPGQGIVDVNVLKKLLCAQTVSVYAHICALGGKIPSSQEFKNVFGLHPAIYTAALKELEAKGIVVISRGGDAA